jgi:hypothetical protein
MDLLFGRKVGGIVNDEGSKPCKFCGKIYKYYRDSSTCCSHSCYNKMNSINRRKIGAWIGQLLSCPICSTQFTQRSAGHKYCSAQCRKEAAMCKTANPVRAITPAKGKRSGIGSLYESQFRICEACGGEYINKYVDITKCPICRGVQRGGYIDS